MTMYCAKTMRSSQIVVAMTPVCYYRRVRRLTFVIFAFMLVSACGHKKVQLQPPQLPQTAQTGQPGQAPQPPQPAQPVQPPQILPEELEGLASYYAEPYHGRKTANGETFDTYKHLTAAHRTLPFNTFVRVTNKTNGREVDVRINDRGPFIDGRVIDLSVRAAREIDLVRPGIAPVRIRVLKATEVLPTSASPRPVYAVQVGAFENPRAAEDLKQRLARKYPDVTVQILPGEKTVYRVRIGRKPDIQTANRLASQLRKQD